MSRVSWKFTHTTSNDLHYFFYKINNQHNFVFDSYRSKSVNNWNVGASYLLEQGKTKITVSTNEFCIDRKLGMFSKTRKPFFFRSKRKKKICYV